MFPVCLKAWSISFVERDICLLTYGLCSGTVNLTTAVLTIQISRHFIFCIVFRAAPTSICARIPFIGGKMLHNAGHSAFNLTRNIGI